MSKWIFLLGGLLVAQLVTAVSVNLQRQDYGAFEAVEKLLSFDAQQVDRLRIEDADGQVLLQRGESGWQLPEYADYPVRQDAVQPLLEKLSALEKGWPVTTSSGAAKRFKVDDDAFERKLVLLDGEQPVSELLVGTSPGFRKVHVRSADDQRVFSVAFNAWEANAQVADWIDKEVLTLAEDDIEQVSLDQLVLKKHGDEWQASNLQDSQSSDTDAARELIERLAGLRIQSLLSTEQATGLNEAQPVYQLQLKTRDNRELEYRLFQQTEDADFILQRSDFEQKFVIPSAVATALKNANRDTLIASSQTEAATSGASAAELADPVDN